MLESRAYRVGEVVANLLILNLLWLLASLPVVTLFPATAAMFGVVRAWQRSDGAPSIVPAFLTQFRRAFAQSALLGGPWLLAAAGIGVAFWAIGRPETLAELLAFGLACTVAAAYLLASVYLFPVLAHYDLGVAETIRYAVVLAIGRLPTTLLCLGVIGSAGLLTAAVPIVAVVVGSATAWAVYWLCARTFPRPDTDGMPFQPPRSGSAPAR